MAKTNWEVYIELQEKFEKAMPQKAEDLEIGIEEAACDYFGVEWNDFHGIRHEEFVLGGLDE